LTIARAHRVCCLRRPNLGFASPLQPSSPIVLTTVLTFLLGVFLAPAIRPLFRPIFVELIRTGLVLTDEVKRMSATLGESMEDARAEAAAASEADPSTEDTPADEPAPASVETEVESPEQGDEAESPAAAN
jgi:hypothetical protein